MGLGLGLTALAVTQYRHMKERASRDDGTDDVTDGRGDIVISGSPLLHLYARLPLRYLSQLWGYVNNELTVPVWARKPLYGIYSWAFNCRLDEAENGALDSYENLGAFFYRSLKVGVRPLATTELVCPSSVT